MIDNSFNCFDIVVASWLAWKGFHFELMFSNCWGFSFKSSASGLISDGLNEWAGEIGYPLESYGGIKLITQKSEAQNALSFVTKELQNDRPVILNTDTFWCPWHERYQRTKRLHSVIVLGMDTENCTLDCADKYTWQSVHGSCKMSFNDFLNGYQSLTTISFEKPMAGMDWRKIIRDAVLCMKNQADYDAIYYLKKGNFVERTVLAFKLFQFKFRKPLCFEEMRLLAQKVNESSLENERSTTIPLERNPLLVHLMLIAHGRKKFADTLKYLGEEQKIENLIYGARLMGNSAWQWGEAVGHLYNYFQTNDPNEKTRFCDGIKTVAIYEEMLADMLIKLTSKR
ncbi:MAG TPA: hypothetical protein DDW50_02665 [Firmicutes bacterium]|nr:hypothetical protein [Bacillota bacterium]